MTESNPITFVGAKEFATRVRGGENMKDKNIGVLKSFIPLAIKMVDEAERIIEFCISDASVDRMGDTIATDGWDLMNFIRGGQPVLFGHDKWQPVVGRGVRTWLEASMLKSHTQFTPKELNPFGFMIFQLYANDYMRATSVGFMPLEYSYAEDRKYGLNFMRQELLEYSMVPVPANPNALMSAKSAGIDIAPMKAWTERALDMMGTETADTMLKAHYERLRQVSDPDGRRLSVFLSDVKFVGSGAPADIPVHIPEMGAVLGELKTISTRLEKLEARRADPDHPAPTQKDPGDETPGPAEAPSGDAPAADPPSADVPATEAEPAKEVASGDQGAATDAPAADPAPETAAPAGEAPPVADEPAKDAGAAAEEDLELDDEEDDLELDAEDAPASAASDTPKSKAAGSGEDDDMDITVDGLRTAIREVVEQQVIKQTGRLD